MKTLLMLMACGLCVNAIAQANETCRVSPSGEVAEVHCSNTSDEPKGKLSVADAVQYLIDQHYEKAPETDYSKTGGYTDLVKGSQSASVGSPRATDEDCVRQRGQLRGRSPSVMPDPSDTTPAPVSASREIPDPSYHPKAPEASVQRPSDDVDTNSHPSRWPTHQD